MASLLPNIVSDLPERIHKIKYKYKHDNKNCEMCRIKYKDCECCLQCTNVKDHDLIKYRYLWCNKNYHRKFDQILKKQFFNTFSNHDINEFILLLQNCVYTCEYKYL